MNDATAAVKPPTIVLTF